jgi:hypothetical protein
MEIRVKETGDVMQEHEFRAQHPNVSGPLDDLYDVILEGPQAQPTRYQVGFRDGVEEIDGQWFTKYSVSDMDDEGKAAVDLNQSRAMRVKRNELLTASDWTQVSDAPVDKAAWATYRQELRDLTSQSGFPWEITWPTAPSA